MLHQWYVKSKLKVIWWTKLPEKIFIKNLNNLNNEGGVFIFNKKKNHNKGGMFMKKNWDLIMSLSIRL